ncbi:MAG: hypothetical protein ACRD1E_11005 [Terriglobales bacterium]
MRRRGIFPALALAGVLGAGLAAEAIQAQPQQPEANPGRPTVSTPATLTPVGYLQLESGFTGAAHSPEFSSRNSFNEVAKLALTPRFELLASAEPVVQYTAAGMRRDRVGGLSLGGQAVLHHGEGAKPTLAASYFHSVYDGGAADFDVGSPTNSAILLASGDVHRFHYDANIFLSERTQGKVRRAQHGQSLSLAHGLGHRITLSGEMWRFTQPFLRGRAAGALGAVAYSASKTLVFDAGVNRGLSVTSTRWEMFLGCTYLLPRRLW